MNCLSGYVCDGYGMTIPYDFIPKKIQIYMHCFMRGMEFLYFEYKTNREHILRDHGQSKQFKSDDICIYKINGYYIFTINDETGIRSICVDKNFDIYLYSVLGTLYKFKDSGKNYGNCIIISCLSKKTFDPYVLTKFEKMYSETFVEKKHILGYKWDKDGNRIY